MTKSPRRVWKSIGVLLGLTLVVAIAAGALFLHRHREAIRCHRIEGTAFEEVRPQFYLHPDLPRLPRQRLVYDLSRARERLAALFGGVQSEPRIVVAHTADLAGRFAGAGVSGGITHRLPFAPPSIVLTPEGMNLDTLSREWARVELRQRLGKAADRIPAWFEEGLALRLDIRPAYGFEAWENLPESIREAPLDDLVSPAAFRNDDTSTAAIRARHEIASWLGNAEENDLPALIAHVRDGGDFQAYYDRRKRAGEARLAAFEEARERQKKAFEESYEGVEMPADPENRDLAPDEVVRRLEERAAERGEDSPPDAPEPDPETPADDPETPAPGEASPPAAPGNA